MAVRTSDEIRFGAPVQQQLDALERSLIHDGCALLVIAAGQRMPSDEVVTSRVPLAFMSRITREGLVIDPAGQPLAATSARAVANGAEVVIIEGTGFNISSPEQTAFVRVLAEGGILERRPVAKPYAEPVGAQLPLACAGPGCLLVQPSVDYGAGLRLLSFNGTPIGSTLLEIDSNGWLGGFNVIPEGNRYFVAWSDEIAENQHGIFAVRVPETGAAKLDPKLLVTLEGRALNRLKLSRGAEGWLATWSHYPNDLLTNREPSTLFAVVLDEGGAPRGDPSIIASDAWAYEVDHFWNGTEFVLSYWRLDLGGQLGRAATLVSIGARGELANERSVERPYGPVASLDERRFVLDRELKLWPIAPDGTSGDSPITAMLGHYPQWYPRLAAGRDVHLLAFIDRDGDGFAWRALLLSGDAQPLAADSTVLAGDIDEKMIFSAPENARENRLRLVFDGQAFLAGWVNRDRKPVLRRIEPTRPDAASITPLDYAATDFELVGGSDGALVTWSESRGCGEDCGESRLLAMPLDRTSRPLLSAPTDLTEWGFGGTLVRSGVFDGERYVIVVEDASSNIKLFAIKGDGSFEGVSVWQAPLFGGSDRDRRPSVAWDGSEFLVAWEHERADGSGKPIETRIHAVRLNRNLQTIDPAPFVVSGAAGEHRAPAVVFDGEQFLVAWRHRRASRADWDLSAAYVSQQAELMTPHGFLLSGQGFDELGLTLSALGSAQPGSAVAAYYRIDSDPAVASARVFLKSLSRGPSEIGVGCGADGDCASGFCTDFVCCESRCSNASGALVCSTELGAERDGLCAPPAEPLVLPYQASCSGEGDAPAPGAQASGCSCSAVASAPLQGLSALWLLLLAAPARRARFRRSASRRSDLKKPLPSLGRRSGCGRCSELLESGHAPNTRVPAEVLFAEQGPKLIECVHECDEIDRGQAALESEPDQPHGPETSVEVRLHGWSTRYSSPSGSRRSAPESSRSLVTLIVKSARPTSELLRLSSLNKPLCFSWAFKQLGGAWRAAIEEVRQA